MHPVIILIVLALVFGAVYFFVNNDQRVESQYYNDLLTQCSMQEDSECCTSSVVTMATSDYLLADDSGQCVNGLSATTAECEGSLTWCQ